MPTTFQTWQPGPRRLAAEVIGTFVLTFVAAGADIVDFVSGGTIGHVARYLAPGLTVTALIWSLSGVSGAHINPAVTLAFVVRGTFPIARVPGYVAAQIIGASAAALLLRAIFKDAVAHGITHAVPPFTTLQAAALETVLTFVLVYVILSTADQKAVVGKNAAIGVGGIVAVCGLAFSPVSGASMNPARSLGPMIAAWRFPDAWLYIVAPSLGAALASVVVTALDGPPTQDDRRAADGAL
ncbi:MAG: aquaporin [Vulcanimicrobiaceae bacterium]